LSEQGLNSGPDAFLLVISGDERNDCSHLVTFSI